MTWNDRLFEDEPIGLDAEQQLELAELRAAMANPTEGDDDLVDARLVDVEPETEVERFSEEVLSADDFAKVLAALHRRAQGDIALVEDELPDDLASHLARLSKAPEVGAESVTWGVEWEQKAEADLPAVPGYDDRAPVATPTFAPVRLNVGQDGEPL